MVNGVKILTILRLPEASHSLRKKLSVLVRVQPTAGGVGVCSGFFVFDPIRRVVECR
jgi:hypothetical protein